MSITDVEVQILSSALDSRLIGFILYGKIAEVNFVAKKSMLHKTFQQKLRETRKAAGLTQADVADALGVRQPTYADIETGSNSPNLATIERIAEALGVSPIELLGEKMPV